MVAEWLKAIGINEIAQWDVLLFLHRHRNALLNTENIARLMRYKTGPLIAALDSLETLGMVERSRLSQGARLYQLTPLGGPRARAFIELLNLSESRAGLLKVAESLRGMRSQNTIHLGLRGWRAATERKVLRKWPKAI